MADRSARLPPMPPLPGAAPGVQPFVQLTPISTPEAARAALTAQFRTFAFGVDRRLPLRHVTISHEQRYP